jgi:hypothetical protein
MSGDVLLNQDAVISMSLHLPMNGAWSGELAAATQATYAVGEVVTLTVLDTALIGRVVRAAQYGDRLSIRLTGGTVDWGLALGVKHYRNTTADQVIADAGITLAASLNVALPFWTRAPGTPGSTIQAVAQYVGLNWRVLPDGAVRVAAEAPELVDPGAVETSRDPARGLVELAPELATVLPGSLVGDDSVGDVVYDLTPDGVRCRYYTEARATLRGTLERLVRWITRNTIYHTTYSAEVIRQAADGTLDLMPDDVRLQSAGLQGVPIRHGLPGVTVEVPAGERVLLAFDGGDPAKPHAMLWHEGQVTKVRIGGTEAVALASLVETRLANMQLAIDTHIHTWPGGLAPAPTTPPTPAIVWPIDPMAAEILETA